MIPCDTCRTPFKCSASMSCRTGASRLLRSALKKTRAKGSGNPKRRHLTNHLKGN
jgi:hypothetical protein